MNVLHQQGAKACDGHQCGGQKKWLCTKLGRSYSTS